jgi:transcriptional regulator with XRE-family HTH domain
MTEQLGSMLVRLRERKGYSQVRVAEGLCAASGVTTVTRHEVSRWERQERIPSAFWLRWLAEALEVPVGELEAAAATARREARAPASAPTATGSAATVPRKGQTTPTRRLAQQEARAATPPARSNSGASLSRVTIEFEHRTTSVRLSATYDDPRRAVSAIAAFRSMVRDSEPVRPEPGKVWATSRLAEAEAAKSDAQCAAAQQARQARSVVQQRRASASAALTASKPARVPMGIRYTRGPEMR